MDTSQPAPRSDQQANRRYLTVWRWHFYFGLLVAPFLTLLAVTGLGMLLFANITGKEGERIHVTPPANGASNRTPYPSCRPTAMC